MICQRQILPRIDFEFWSYLALNVHLAQFSAIMVFLAYETFSGMISTLTALGPLAVLVT